MNEKRMEQLDIIERQKNNLDDFITQSLRLFTRAVDQAGDWFYDKNISVHQRTKQSTGAILRALNKLNEECNNANLDLDFVLSQMYLKHVGRKAK